MCVIDWCRYIFQFYTEHKFRECFIASYVIVSSVLFYSWNSRGKKFPTFLANIPTSVKNKVPDTKTTQCFKRNENALYKTLVRRNDVSESK